MARKDKPITIQLRNNFDVSLLAFALCWALEYEAQDVEYVKHTKRREDAKTMAQCIRFKAQTYSELLKFIIRQMERRSGGIYRRDWKELRETLTRIINNVSEKAAQECEIIADGGTHE
jgi:hypothetical protein